MASQTFPQNMSPERSSSPESYRDANGRKYKKANIYDAVAGKISSSGLIPKHLVYSSSRDTTSTSVSAVAPENVLFKRKGAPDRYHESDIYFANERNSTKWLPDSDLLKALHCYTSDFYFKAVANGGAGDWRSLDETALIALGILMEEASRGGLGQTGDLAFTEGEPIETFQRKERSASKECSSKRRRTDTHYRVGK